MKLSHAAIAVKNMEESVKFYTQVLGLKEVRRFTPREGMKVVFIKGEGEGMIELIEGIDKFEWKIDSGGAILLVGLEIPDLNATAQSLRAKGVNFTHGPMEVQGGTKIAFLKDPDGVEVELIQKSPNF